MKVIIDGKLLDANSVSIVFEDISADGDTLSFMFEESGINTLLTTSILDDNTNTKHSEQEDIEQVYDNLLYKQEEDLNAEFDDEEV